MKRIISLLLSAVLILTFTACSSKTKDIEGTITGYVQVEAYTNPLIVIQDNGKTYYLALAGNPTAYNHGEDAGLLAAIQNGNITDIKVSIDGAEKGKALEIDGEKVTVWQSHQIHQME